MSKNNSVNKPTDFGREVVEEVKVNEEIKVSEGNPFGAILKSHQEVADNYADQPDVALSSFTDELVSEMKPTFKRTLDLKDFITKREVLTLTSKILKEEVRDYVRSLLGNTPGSLKFEEFTPASFVQKLAPVDITFGLKNYFPSSDLMINNGTGVKSILIFESKLEEITTAQKTPVSFVEEALMTAPERAFKIPHGDEIFGKNNAKLYLVNTKDNTIYMVTNTLLAILGTVNVDLNFLNINGIKISIGEKGDYYYLHFSKE